MCNDISAVAGERTHRSVPVRCFGMPEWKTALNSSVHTTSALSWVLIDMPLFRLTRFWSGMRQAEAIRISTPCVSKTSKYHLGGFPFALWSLAVRWEAGLRQQQRQRHWQELSMAFSPTRVFEGPQCRNEAMFVVWKFAQAWILWIQLSHSV